MSRELQNRVVPTTPEHTHTVHWSLTSLFSTNTAYIRDDTQTHTHAHELMPWTLCVALVPLSGTSFNNSEVRFVDIG